MQLRDIVIESIGWISSATFLFSIVVPQRLHLHSLGVFTAVTTGIYAYSHGATAIWVKWFVAFFFHAYMWYKISRPPTDAPTAKFDPATLNSVEA